jgi:hypothetical protein
MEKQEERIMLQKTKDKLERKNRKTWVGLYTRRTPTKQEKLERVDKKYKGKEY